MSTPEIGKQMSTEVDIAGSMSNSSIDKARATGTALAVGAYSNLDYLAVIAAGEALAAGGMKQSLAAAIAATAGALETGAASYAAQHGMGDFKYEPKTSIGRKLSEYSPAVSLWRGAPSGVMIDQATGKEITAKRRILHSVPYGVALGAWVASPVPEYVTKVAVNTSSSVTETAKEEVAGHPIETISLLGAVALASIVRKVRNKKSSVTKK